MRTLALIAGLVISCPLVRAQSRLFDGEQLPAGPGGWAFHLADADGNGTLDLSTSSGTVTLTDGHGHLGTPQSSPYNVSGGQRISLVADVSGDGRADLILGIDGPAPAYPGLVVVRISDGLGGFSSSTVYTTSLNAFPSGLAVGDLNLDGQMDIVMAELFAGNLAILPGTGGGAFGTPTYTPLISPVSQLRMSDLNGDGFIDLLSRGAQNQISVRLGNGTLGFGLPSSISIPGGPGYYEGLMLVNDVNEDGQPDLVNTYLDGTLDTRLGNGLGGFGPPQVSVLGAGVRSAVLGDLDLDGHLDIVSWDVPHQQVVVLRGNGLGTFAASGGYRAAGLGAIGLTDFDGDGDLDAIVGSSASRVTVLLGDGQGAFSDAPPAEIFTTESALNMVVRDFDSDGKPDAVVTLGANSAALFRGNGTTGFGSPSTVLSGQGVGAIDAGDFNGDGHQDLVVVAAGSSTTNLEVWLGNGVGGFAQSASMALANAYTTLTAVDFDSNGTMDVLVTNGGVSMLVRGNGSGGFGTVTTNPAYGYLAVDFDGDGWLDLVSQGTNALLVLHGSASGVLTGPTSVPVALSSLSLMKVLDIDADGDLDLLSVTNAAIVIHLRNVAGVFGAPQYIRLDAFPRTSVLGDVNADGLPDLCLALSNQTSVVVILGTGAGQFAEPRSFAVAPYPISLRLTDVDADGLLDVVTANGLNNTSTGPFGSLGVLRNRLRQPLPPQPLCFGNGTGSACPCGNSGGPARGCGNSIVSIGARLLGSGATRISSDSFELECRDYPSGAGLYFGGSITVGGGIGSPFGDGLLCAGGSLVRLGVASASGTGLVQTSFYPGPQDVPISIQGQAMPGSTLAYQCFYRDANPSFCTNATFNSSNAIAGTWVP